MGRAGEVEQGASELAVGNDDDVQSSVPPPWPRELAHTQVLLLLAILLVAHQVIRQEPLLPEAVQEAAENALVRAAIWVGEQHVHVTTGCLSPTV